MNSIHRLPQLALAVLLSLFVATITSAADNDSERASALLKSHLRFEDSLVAQVDLKSADLAQIGKSIEKLLQQAHLTPPAEIVQHLTVADEFRQQLVQAGAASAYVLASSADLMQGQCTVIFPTPSIQVAQSIAGKLRPPAADSSQQGPGKGDRPDSVSQLAAAARSPDGRPWSVTATADSVVWGPEGRETPLQAPAQRVTRLAGVLQNLPSAPIQLVVLPDLERRALAESNPPLPAQLSITVPELVKGLDWMAISLSHAPHLQCQWLISTDSPATAGRLQKGLQSAAQLLVSQAPEDQRQRVTSLTTRMLPRVDGSTLVGRVDASENWNDELQLLQSVLQQMRQRAGQMQSVNNLKQLALGMWSFEATYGSLPPWASYDDAGRPLLSWRVYLLPYLGQEALFREFRLNEPWDSLHNRALLEKMPDVFRSADPAVPANHTTYQVPIGSTVAFGSQTGRTVSEFVDGTSQTVLIVEVEPQRAVEWTRPADWEVDLQKPQQGLPRGPDQATPQTRMARADGSVHTVDLGSLPDETLRRLLEIADGQPIDE
ncbi:MAG: DUF1559 domain-containing protein [Pirellulales bacterium]